MLGGVGNSYAKVLASRLIETDVEKECVLINPDTVDRGSICKLADDSEEGAKWINKVAVFQAEAPSAISKKQNNLTDTMEKPASAKWMGALVCSTSLFVEMGAKRSGAPWARLWVQPRGGSVVVQPFRAEGFVDQGLAALGDLPQFLETSSGGKLLDSDNWVLLGFRRSDGIAEVPPGYLVAITNVPSEDDKNQSQLAFAWSLVSLEPRLSKVLCSKVGSDQCFQQEPLREDGEQPVVGVKG